MKYQVYGVERWDNSVYECGEFDTREEAEKKVNEIREEIAKIQSPGLRDSIGIREVEK